MISITRPKSTELINHVHALTKNAYGGKGQVTVPHATVPSMAFHWSQGPRFIRMVCMQVIRYRYSAGAVDLLQG